MKAQLHVRMASSLMALVCVGVVACGAPPAFREQASYNDPVLSQDTAGSDEVAPPKDGSQGELDAGARTAVEDSSTTASQDNSEDVDSGTSQYGGGLQPALGRVLDPMGSPADESRTGIDETLADVATLSTSAIVVRQGDVRSLAALVHNPLREPLAFAFVPTRGMPENFGVGTVTAQGVYTAPASIVRPGGFEGSLQAAVQVTAGGRSLGEILISLIPSDSFVIADDSETQGLVGNVYDFEGRKVDRLPDYSTMTPVASVVMPDVHVPLRNFSTGFPGVPDLFEWFGIRFTGRLKVDLEGEYTFALISDDGARFYVNEALVVDNDGVHGSRTRTGKVRLKPGLHPVRLDYFQGPRYHIQVELHWQKPGETKQSLVPAESLFRPVP